MIKLLDLQHQFKKQLGRNLKSNEQDFLKWMYENQKKLKNNVKLK